MVRNIRTDKAGKVYRAVVTRPDGTVEHFGPYTRKSTAKGQVTSSTGPRECYNYQTRIYEMDKTPRGTGKVQEAVIEWKDVA